jgi:hypothetical protein
MKTIIVQWDADAYKEFTHLQQAVLEGQKAKKQPSYEQLLSSINNAIQNLKTDAFYGNLIPRKYLSRTAG